MQLTLFKTEGREGKKRGGEEKGEEEKEDEEDKKEKRRDEEREDEEKERKKEEWEFVKILPASAPSRGNATRPLQIPNQ
ncbi:hypothetical protein PoB_002773200 [Plakobranchus ocellatus]|uniref:Uncharacterized protein n=1 Tax=Plakobranchus ocellatus TaxID=259542 RepID=A0AAV4A305_9GAST|nr:hypothetical protein PoB_002773200 [Plakobranchus ocellatus]